MLSFSGMPEALLLTVRSFKKYVIDLAIKPDVICFQDTWLRPHLDLIIPGYWSIRSDRLDRVVSVLREGLEYHNITVSYECVAVGIYSAGSNIKLQHFHNPSHQLSVAMFDEISGELGSREIWYGNFNTHGEAHIQMLIVLLWKIWWKPALVCLNDGCGTRVGVVRGVTSCLDLSLASNSIVSLCECNVMNDSTVGRDHFLISLTLMLLFQIEYHSEDGAFHKADWEKFVDHCLKVCWRAVFVRPMWQLWFCVLQIYMCQWVKWVEKKEGSSLVDWRVRCSYLRKK